MTNNHIKPGFILVSTFLMLTVAMLIVTRMYYKGSMYNLYIPTVTQKEQARRLAYSGIHIAICQLSLHDSDIISDSKEESQEAKEKKNTPEQRRKNLLKTLLHVLNNWQKFVLDELQDGIDGEIGICITSEEGKIPLQALIDYKKRTFLKKDKIDGAEILKEVFEKVRFNNQEGDIVQALQSFIKDCSYTFVDAAQLLAIKEFKSFPIQLFYEPSLNSDEKKQYYLADLFTLWNNNPTIDPLLLSPSVRLLLGCEYPSGKTDIESEQITTTAEKFPFSYVSWQKDWDTYLKPIYKQEYKSIPKAFLPLLSGKFEPHLFSVLCYGKIGRIKQKLLAIIERSFTDVGEVFAVKRVYWL